MPNLRVRVQRGCASPCWARVGPRTGVLLRGLLLYKTASHSKC